MVFRFLYSVVVFCVMCGDGCVSRLLLIVNRLLCVMVVSVGYVC